MMGRITFDVKLFLNDADTPRSRKVLLGLMEALCYANLLWLIDHPLTPKLYASGVQYQAEENTEVWQDIPTMLNSRFGDCEDLACWRVAELRNAGIKAHPYLKWRLAGPRASTYHATVRLPDGRIEDPSAALGMNGLYLPPPVFVSPGPMPSGDEA